MIWTHGDVYEGEWLGTAEDGTPDGEGVYVWLDAGYYQGDWKAGCRHGSGCEYTVNDSADKFCIFDFGCVIRQTVNFTTVGGRMTDATGLGY